MVIVPALITRAARIDCLPFALNRLAVNPKSVALASAMASFDEETVSTDNIGPITSLLTSGSELSIEPTRMPLNLGLHTARMHEVKWLMQHLTDFFITKKSVEIVLW